MKKIVIMSDNHGQDYCLKRIIELEPDGNYYIHCGDSEANETLLQPFYCVRGNNDWTQPNLKDELVLTFEGVVFYVCHGHRTRYSNRYEDLSHRGRMLNADVVLFGHTHMPCDEIVNGIRLINPGSTCLPRGGSIPSYACIIIENNEMKVEIKPFN